MGAARGAVFFSLTGLGAAAAFGAFAADAGLAGDDLVDILKRFGLFGGDLR